MSKREKLLAKIQNNRKEVRFEDLTKVLEWYGFELKRVKGSHHSYVRGHHNLTVSRRTPHLRSSSSNRLSRLSMSFQEKMMSE